MFPEKWKSAEWHHPTECYVHEDGEDIRIGNSLIERVLSREGGYLQTKAITNKRTGRTWRTDTRAEARLSFGASSWRRDVITWRYAPGSPQWCDPSEDVGFQQGFHRPDHNDQEWSLAECLTAADALGNVWNGFTWFRVSLPLPIESKGQQVTFGLGGYDHEDWEYYRVFVNGRQIGVRELSGRWREPAPFVLRPDDPEYSCLRFGTDNILAVQVGRLNKLLPGTIPAESARYYYRSRICDQFVAVGSPVRTISEFSLTDFWPDNEPPIIPEYPDYRPNNWAAGGDRDWTWLTIWAENEAEEIRIVHHYQVRRSEPAIRKKIEIQNLSDSPRVLMDVHVEDFALDGTTTDGGQGDPVFVDDEAFSAIEHPAGVNQGLGKGIRLFHLPGKVLAPGQALMSREAIFGVTQAGDSLKGFHEYLRENGRRRQEWVSVYDPCGITDGYMNPQDPRYHVTEQMVLDSIEMLDSLRSRGITMDYYFIDVGWQDHFKDLTWLKDDNFPNGLAKILDRLDQIGVRFGLWFSTIYRPWSAGNYPDVQGCVIPNSRKGDAYDDGLCLAAEPYRTLFRDAVLHHIQENKVKGLKIDMAKYYCNSADHDHLPGKYSVEAQMDGTLQMARHAIRACPDLFLMWYWGHHSPFWLLYGDTIQDKGLKWEAVQVASWPNPVYRSSASLGQDQYARHSKFVPPISHDSLGIWIGDTIQRNRIGTEHWRDAWILELARGSLLDQPWGNLATFDGNDVEFLAEWYAFVRHNWRLLLNAKSILGDPWNAEVYGYASGDGTHTLVTINNPGYRAARVNLRLNEEISLEPVRDGFIVRQRYRRRREIPPSAGARHPFNSEIQLDLRPFEVVVLEIGEHLDRVGWTDLPDLRVIDSTNLPVETQGVPADSVPFSVPVSNSAAGIVREHSPRATIGQVKLPAIDQPMTLGLIAKQTRNGLHWHHREVHALMKLRAQIGEQDLPYQNVPRHWLQSGAGSPWLIFEMPVEPAHSGQTIRFQLAGLLPQDVQSRFDAWLYDPWWRR